MSSLFRKPKVPKPPAPPAPPAIPETGDISEMARKFSRKRKGRAQTVLAGDLIPEGVGEKSILG